MRLLGLLLCAGLATAGHAQEAPRVVETPPPPAEPPRAVETPKPAKSQPARSVVRIPTVDPQVGAVAPQDQSSPACSLPAPSSDAAIVSLSLYEGQAVSSVALGSQARETTAIDVFVEPGRRPIYLVVTSYDQLVVNLRGAVSRVEQLVFFARPRNAMGAVGIPRTRVSFADQRACGLSWSAYEAPRNEVAQALSAALGRPPAVIGGTYELATARVSDRAVVTQAAPRAPAAPGARGEMLLFYPAGVKRLDAAAVVASAPAAPYEVLPSTAGIVQLLAAGKLEAGSRADVEAWAKVASRRPGRTAQDVERERTRIIGQVYVVRRAFAVPAELCGAHAVTFVVPNGVPTPQGNPCHSAVLLPDGGIR